MQALWHALPTEVFTSLHSQIEANFDKLSTTQFAMVLHGLSHMNMKYSQLSPELREKIVNKIANEMQQFEMLGAAVTVHS